MPSSKLYQIIFLLLSLFAFHGTLPAQTTLPAADVVYAPDGLIHFGDLIEVDVEGSYEYDWRGTITPEGYLNGLDFIEEPIYALCKSESEVAAQIAKGYSKILKDPQIAVKILDRSDRAVSVLSGAIKKSQRFQIKRPVYLNEILILSGGLTEESSGQINIFRPRNLSCESRQPAPENIAEKLTSRERFVNASQNDGSQTININIAALLRGDKSANPQILSGDLITAESSEPVYVIGGVTTPKQISFRSQTTLSRAISAAGGLAKDALPAAVTIFRRENRDTKIIEADLTKIEKGEAPDVELKALDIVEVGQRGKSKRKYPPVVRSGKTEGANTQKLPLIVID